MEPRCGTAPGAGVLITGVEGSLRRVSETGVREPESPKIERLGRAVSVEAPCAGVFASGVARVVTGAFPAGVLLRVRPGVPRGESEPREMFSAPRPERVEGASTAGLPPTTPPLTVERLKVTGLLPEGTMPFSFRRGMAVWPKLALPRVVEEAVRTTGGVFGNSER